MRKLLAFLLAVACLSFAGCDQPQEQTQDDSMVTAYLETAQTYIDSGDVDTAIAVLEEGCQKTGNHEKITALLEKLKTEKSQQEQTEAPAEEPTETPTEPVPVITYEYRYEIVQSDVSWTEANAACQAKGGYLVTIDSPEEYAQIWQMADAYNSTQPEGQKLIYLWMGARLVPGTSVWKWSNGRTIPLVNYYWYENEPSYMDGNVPEDCLCLWNLNHNGYPWTLNDQRDNLVRDFPKISGKIGYICEYKIEVHS